MRSFPRTPLGALCSLVATVALTPALAHAQAAPPSPSDPQPTTGPYQVFWAAGNTPPSNGEPAQDWVGNMSFGDVPVRRDIFVLYESEGGLFPYAGIQQVESDPDWMRRHFLKLQHSINWYLPDPNQGGYGAIDYEEFEPCWSLLTNIPSNQGPAARDMDFKDDWRDYIRQSRPQALVGVPTDRQEAVFESTYNDAIRRFYVATINECKRLRPNMRWGFYLFPPRTYYGMLTASGRAEWASKTTPYLGWLYDAQDAFFPDVYSLLYTVADRQPDMYIQEDALWQFQEYIRWNITQAVQLANGKPVIAFVYLRYHPNAHHYVDQFLNDVNLENSFSLPKQYGAAGVALWEAIGSRERAAADQEYITNKVVPAIRAHFTDAAGNPLTAPQIAITASPGAGSGPGPGTPPVDPGASGNAQTPPVNDPLRTRPYVNVRPDPDPSDPAGGTGSSQPTEPTNANPPRGLNRPGTVNLPRNARGNRGTSTRNPAWPAVVQRGVARTN